MFDVLEAELHRVVGDVEDAVGDADQAHVDALERGQRVADALLAGFVDDIGDAHLSGAVVLLAASGGEQDGESKGDERDAVFHGVR